MLKRCRFFLIGFHFLVGLTMLATTPSLAVQRGFKFLAQDTASDSEKNVPKGQIAMDKTFNCEPTPPDSMGPFYKSNAPVRSSVGEGYVLDGVVKSAQDCSPISGAQIEFWLTGSDGRYDDRHRATVYSGEWGKYRLGSNFPTTYGSRPPHIHIRVTVDGYKSLVTQHYPDRDNMEGNFDLVLIPER